MLIFTTPDMDRFQDNTSLTMCITLKVKWYKELRLGVRDLANTNFIDACYGCSSYSLLVRGAQVVDL